MCPFYKRSPLHCAIDPFFVHLAIAKSFPLATLVVCVCVFVATQFISHPPAALASSSSVWACPTARYRPHHGPYVVLRPASKTRVHSIHGHHPLPPIPPANFVSPLYIFLIHRSSCKALSSHMSLLHFSTRSNIPFVVVLSLSSARLPRKTSSMASLYVFTRIRLYSHPIFFAAVFYPVLTLLYNALCITLRFVESHCRCRTLSFQPGLSPTYWQAPLGYYRLCHWQGPHTCLVLCRLHRWSFRRSIHSVPSRRFYRPRSIVVVYLCPRPVTRAS